MLHSLEMPKDELPNHNCIKHLRSVVQQQQTRIAELEKTSAEHKHQLAEQVGPCVRGAVWQRGLSWEGSVSPAWAPNAKKGLWMKKAAAEQPELSTAGALLLFHTSVTESLGR